MVREIESRTSGDTVKSLRQLAIDIVCDMVYFKIESFLAGNSMLTEYSVIDNLLLPKRVTDVVSTRLNNVVMTYFDLFIEPSIVYDWDERLSIL